MWQRDLAPPAAGEDGKLASGASAAAVASDDKLSDTWRHVKLVAREVSKEHDLLDLLQNTRREDTYQFPVPGVRGTRRP